MKKWIVVSVLVIASLARGQMLSSLTAKPVLYVMVSTATPESVLNGLALDAASSAGSVVLVLRGFPTAPGRPFSGSFEQSQQWIAQANQRCCAHHPQGFPSWIVDPKLFDKFQVQSSPTFVLTHPGLEAGPTSFTKMSGDWVSVAGALKAFASASQIPALRQAAQQILQRTFKEY